MLLSCPRGVPYVARDQALLANGSRPAAAFIVRTRVRGTAPTTAAFCASFGDANHWWLEAAKAMINRLGPPGGHSSPNVAPKVAIMGRRMAVMERRGERLATGIVALALRDRPAARDAVLRRIADADLDPANLPHPGHPGRGRVRHRLRPGRVLALALELHGASDSQGTHPGHRQSRHRVLLRSHGGGVLMAHRRMAEFDPRADGTRAGHERAPVQGMYRWRWRPLCSCWDSPGSLR